MGRQQSIFPKGASLKMKYKLSHKAQPRTKFEIKKPKINRTKSEWEAHRDKVTAEYKKDMNVKLNFNNGSSMEFVSGSSEPIKEIKANPFINFFADEPKFNIPDFYDLTNVPVDNN